MGEYRTSVVVVRWIIVCCLSLASGFAQSAGRPMTLDVVVTDKAGKAVSGLQEQDFTLLDSKKPQKISAFRAVEGIKPESPVEVILLVDAVNTAFTKVAFARDQIEKFLKRDGGELARPMSMAFLTDSGLTIGESSSRDGNALAAQLNQKVLGLRTVNRDQGVYGADERLQLSLQAIESLIRYETPRPGRKLVVWVSPGWPMLSGPGVEMQLTPKQRQSIFNSVVTISEGLRRARVTIYDVDPLGMSDAGSFQTFAYEQYLKGVKKADQAQNANLALQVLAIESGGRVFNTGNDVSGEIAQCAADANAYYEITYQAQAGDGPAEYHALEMKMDKKGLTPHTRTGIYALE